MFLGLLDNSLNVRNQQRETILDKEGQALILSETNIEPQVPNLIQSPLYNYATQTIRMEYDAFISKRDKTLDTLNDNNWLNEDVLDLYFQLYLQPIANTKKNYTVFIGNYFTVCISDKSTPEGRLLSMVKCPSHFMNAILRKYNMDEVHRIVTWINLANTHWALMVIDFKFRKIHYLDPFGSYSRGGNIDSTARNNATRMLKVLMVLGYIKVVPGSSKVNPDSPKYNAFNYIDPSWKDIKVINTSYQTNSYDCGVFLLTFAEMFANNYAQLEYEYAWVINVNMRKRRKEIKATLYAFSDWRKYLNTYATHNHALKEKNLYAEVCEIDVNSLKEDSKPSFFESFYDPKPLEVLINN